MQESRRKDIRRTAAVVREKCKVSRYGIIDLFKECARLGYKLIRYPLGENADLGFTIKKDQDIVIFTNSSIRLSREIFTLAHELGHAVLHMEADSSLLMIVLLLQIEVPMSESRKQIILRHVF